MDAKLAEWRTRAPAAMCRCCLSESCYKDISTEYYWMGVREVYSEMLKDTFDVMITYCSAGGLSRLICETCISRLREAAAFKKQVQECEAAVTRLLGASEVCIEIPAEVKQEDDMKVEEKTEEEPPIIPETSDFDNRDDEMPIADVDGDDDDDLDDEPLTKLASRNLKKEPVDLQDILDNAKPTEKRKSSSRLKASAEKKPKKENVKDKKQKAKVEKQTVEKKNKGPKSKIDLEINGQTTQEAKEDDEIVTHRIQQQRNTEIILIYSTAYPFKTKFAGIICVHCNAVFKSLELLRSHMKEHINKNFSTNIFDRNNFVNIDITDLKCKICGIDILDVDALVSHFTKDHNKPFYVKNRLDIIPFKQNDKNEFICVFCPKVTQQYIYFKRHIISHFMNYSCLTCGMKFLSKQAVRDHNRVVKCSKNTYKPRDGRVLNHRANAEIILKNSNACPFWTWNSDFNCTLCKAHSENIGRLRRHMNFEHPNYDVQSAFYPKLRNRFLKIDITDLKCKICSKEADGLEDFAAHLKEEHKQPIDNNVQLGVLPFQLGSTVTTTVKVWNCSICQCQLKDFESLSKHTVEHFQNYVCDICGEGFITHSAMIAHRKIPHENKYKCSRCVATFTTMEERNGHIKTHTRTPYMCVYCADKPRFATWDLRKKHLMKVHNKSIGADKYECGTCHKTFSSRSGKYGHIMRNHRPKKSNLTSHTCSQCPKSFTSKLFLDKHVSSKHGLLTDS